MCIRDRFKGTESSASRPSSFGSKFLLRQSVRHKCLEMDTSICTRVCWENKNHFNLCIKSPTTVTALSTNEAVPPTDHYTCGGEPHTHVQVWTFLNKHGVLFKLSCKKLCTAPSTCIAWCHLLSVSSVLHLKALFIQNKTLWSHQLHWSTLVTTCKHTLSSQSRSDQVVVDCSLHASIWGKIVNLMPICISFFKVEISLCTPTALFQTGSVHSGSASWDDCGWAFLVELHVISFPWYVPTLCLNSIVSPPWLQWVKSRMTGVFYVLLR